MYLTDLGLPPPAGPDEHADSDDRSGERRGGRCSTGRPQLDSGWSQRNIWIRRCKEPARAGDLVPDQGGEETFLLTNRHVQPLRLVCWGDVEFFLSALSRRCSVRRWPPQKWRWRARRRRWRRWRVSFSLWRSSSSHRWAWWGHSATSL